MIEVGSTQDGRETEFSARDIGVGFNVQCADELFGLFQRLHGADGFETTGIGLANVRRIVNRHGGHIWAEGHEGRGAIFSSRYPGLRRRTMDDTGVILLVRDNPNDTGLAFAAPRERRPTPEAYIADDGEAVPFDLGLPEVDGLGVLERKGADPDLTTIPVAMDIPPGEERDLLRSHGAGTKACGAKPTSFEGSIEAIGEVGPLWVAPNQLPRTTDHSRWT